jgi:hypothetical protein
MPYYLADVAEHGSLEEAIYGEILVPGAKLRDEPRFLLSQESKIREADIYFAVLRAISDGKNKPNEIATHLQREPKSIRNFLDALIEIGLVEKRYPITQATRKNFILDIKDPFLRFWFEFVAPFVSRLEDRDSARAHLTNTVMPNLDKFVSMPGFEEICRQWAVAEYDDAAAMGSWWGSIRQMVDGDRRNKQFEVDVVGIDHLATPVILGSCKWTNSPQGMSELKKLKTVQNHLDAPDAKLLFFSRSNVDTGIEQAASSNPNIRIVSPQEL